MSLMVEMGYEGSTKLASAVMGINYGFDKLRFINPVKVNNKISDISSMHSHYQDGGL